MKILHISNLNYVKAGGINFVVPQMVLEENSYHIDSVLFNLNKTPYPNDYVLKKNRYVYKSDKELEYTLELLKPDFAIFHGIYRRGFVKTGRILKGNNIKYLIKPHGGLTFSAQKKLKKVIANSLLYRNFFRDCFGTIFLNENELQKSIKLNKRNYIIPNGIQIEKMLSNENNKGKIINFTFIGRIDIYNKGLDILFESLKDFDEARVKFNFYGIGNDKQIENLTRLLKDNSGLAEFHGPVYDDIKKNVLRNTDIFIQTSRSEGQPMSILEALSYGVPCLVSNETNIGGEINHYDAGWVCNLSSDDITKKINLAIGEYRKNPWQYKENAYRLANELFSWPIVAEKSKLQYQQILRDVRES